MAPKRRHVPIQGGWLEVMPPDVEGRMLLAEPSGPDFARGGIEDPVFDF
jgi:hypothetical protein